ncbi:MAG TPA: bifunctional hydroxymethylpyrimidine kinase/phosphomethylpyrimidine kinase [Ruminococcaceae bacterium]|nr:bifunctional hydroxymethylpyrimidine kinase/phosphomethylpyrimidine kinase [Oscillospiraceae bacterium]
MKKVLTVAGSDCSGGAGIQADIKTIAAHKMYAMSAITALTAQNTTGVFGVLEADGSFVKKQLDCIFTDIFPDAVKIGMVSSCGIIEAVAERLLFYNAKNIVIDPVMISTSGSRLLNGDAADALISTLLPVADIITPNIPEAEFLTGMNIDCCDDMLIAVKKLSTLYGGSILIKGGHLPETSDDLLYSGGEFIWFKQARINNPNTHGTGCTLSSAVACGLANGFDIKTSVKNAKQYVTGALLAGLNIGRGNGPLNHCYSI